MPLGAVEILGANKLFLQKGVDLILAAFGRVESRYRFSTFSTRLFSQQNRLNQQEKVEKVEG